MPSAPKLLEKMRSGSAGHRRRNLIAVLEYYGFTFSREALHGSLYKHPDLSAHPDLEVRMGPARVLVPKGREMPEYVVEQVVASVDLVIAWHEEKSE